MDYQGRLKLIFAGGNWPTITTTKIPADWMPYHTFKAIVTVARPSVVGFAVMQEKSMRGGGWDNTVSRWVKTAFAQPGKNEISAPLHPDGYSIHPKLGKVMRFEIFMYGFMLHSDARDYMNRAHYANPPRRAATRRFW